MKFQYKEKETKNITEKGYILQILQKGKKKEILWTKISIVERMYSKTKLSRARTIDFVCQISFRGQRFNAIQYSHFAANTIRNSIRAGLYRPR